MTKILSRAKLQSLDRANLNALVQAIPEVVTKELLQSHYTVENSLEELSCAIHCAFNKWRWCKEEYADYLQYLDITESYDNPYRWGCILATFSDHLVFYTDTSSGGPCYFSVSYEVIDGCVHIGLDVKAVDAKIVISALNNDEVAQAVTELVDKPKLSQAISSKERKALPDEDFAGPNRTFPIADQDDVESAKHLIGKASNPSAVKKKIISIAKRKGLTIPDAWKQGASMAEVKQGDVVDTDTAITDTAISNQPAGTTAKKPADLSKPATEANSDGAAKVDALDPENPQGVENDHTDLSGSGNLNTPGTGVIDAKKSKIAKQSVARTEANLLQSAHRDAIGQSLAYMKLQSTETGKDGKKHMKLQGIVTRADIVNTENQVYPLSVWQANLPKMNELAQAGKFLGKVEHPDKELGLQDVALKFDKFWLQGSDVWADVTVVPTHPYGENLQAMVEAGVQVDFSSRGYGTMRQSDWRGTQRDVIQDDFECIAFDAVWHGASTGSGVKQVAYQSATNNNDKKETVMEKTPAQIDAEKVQSEQALKDYRKGLIQSAGLNDAGKEVYSKALKACKSIDEMFNVKTHTLSVLQSMYTPETKEEKSLNQSKTWAPTFIVKQSQEDKAPQSVGEMFDRMVADLPDNYPGVDAGLNRNSHFQSPKAACRKMLEQVYFMQSEGFHGESAAKALLALEQGKTDRAASLIQSSNLYQSFSSDSTIANANTSNDGAPLSAPLIFPLVRRVFPMYIMNRIASIQPMDRPHGKIFFKDAYRTEDPAGYEKRIDLNTSANPFNSSWSDNNTEGSAASIVRLRLTSIDVVAYTKKIMAQWSIEEMQDLRAYHGLDAAQELMSDAAKEMALEWNKTVLDDMLAQATAGNLTYNTGAPTSGFPNQKDWDEYIWNYVAKLDSLIFAKRNNPMTHMICGVDAALALNKSFRGAFTLGNNADQQMELYPGTTFYGTVNGAAGASYQVFKTNFWTTGTANGSKILGLRRGQDWSDTPYVYAPYVDYCTPQLTDPADYSQRQGIMSRAAKQVVVSDAMGTITVATGTGSTI